MVVAISVTVLSAVGLIWCVGLAIVLGMGDKGLSQK